MPTGVLMPVEKEPEKSRAAQASTVYKCIMVKCDIDSEVDDKDIRIKIVYNTVDHYVPLCKDFKNKSKKYIFQNTCQYLIKFSKCLLNLCKNLWKKLF